MKLLLEGRIIDARIGRRRTIVCADGRELAPTDVAPGAVRLREATAEEWEELRRGGYAVLWARRVTDGQ